ncbi:MAG: LPS export ABC transporter permease LptF [Gammaproteobacteria bacterium]|nr:LPS export ABC transporter permease LptF [Gammaproteobacteria bacterium]
MIIYRYFAREVCFTTLAVAGIVLVIAMGWRFSGYLNDAADGLLTRDVLLILMAYRLPGFLELILPVSFFLAILLTYGRMYVDSEMIVLKSCGLSPTRLVTMTLGLAAIVVSVMVPITLWLKPAGEARVAALFREQRNLTEFDTLAAGRFQSLRSGQRVTYAEELADDGRLNGIFITELRGEAGPGPKDVVTVVADRGAQQLDVDGARFLVLRDGQRYRGKPGDHDYQVIDYEEYGQLVEKSQARARAQRRTAIPTWDLESTDPREGSELQWRISIILMVPMIAVMAVPLSRVNPRQGRFTRLIPGMILCFMYVVLLSTARSAVEREQIPMTIGLWWIHAAYLVLVAVLLRNERLVR